MAAFATFQDVELRWRPLTSEEDQSRAEVLLSDASDIIRSRFPDIDDRLEAGTMRPETVLRVTAGMVKRAMSAGDREGVQAAQETAGPFSQSLTYANPNGNLYLSADDIRALDNHRRRAFAIDLTPPPVA